MPWHSKERHELEIMIKRNEDNFRDLWYNVKCPNIWIIGVPEEEDKKKGHEKILEEIIVENFLKMEKEMATHSSVPAWRIPGMGEPGGLPSMESHRVGHDWSDLAAAAAAVMPLGTSYQSILAGEFKDGFVL